MKLAVIAAAFVALAGATSLAHAAASADGVFSVTEMIVDNGNGTYTYDYALTNVSSSAVAWLLVVGTNSTDISDKTGFAGWDAASSAASWTPLGTTNVVATSDTQDNPPFGALPHALAQGQTFAGFSYTSTLYDPTPKGFVIDVAGFWGNPEFSYEGLTTPATAAVPENSSAALLLAGAGLLAFAARRRRAN
jgi:hypothetical protein